MFNLGDLESFKELKKHYRLHDAEIYVINVCLAYHCFNQLLAGDIEYLSKNKAKKRPIVIYKSEGNKAYFFPLSTDKKTFRGKDIVFDYSKCTIQSTCNDSITQKKAIVFISYSYRTIPYKKKKTKIPMKFHIDLLLLDDVLREEGVYKKAAEYCKDSTGKIPQVIKYCGLCNKDYVNSVKRKIYDK